MYLLLLLTTKWLILLIFQGDQGLSGPPGEPGVDGNDVSEYSMSVTF